MKTSVTSYSFGDYISPEKLGYLGIIDKAAETGFDGIEFTDSKYLAEDENSAEKIRERCEKCGIEPVAFAV